MGTDENIYVTEVLPQVIGPKFANLIRRLGFETLSDLATVHDYFIEALPGFGPKRMSELRKCLNEHGYDFAEPIQSPLLEQIQENLNSLRTASELKETPRDSFRRSVVAAECAADTQILTPQDRLETHPPEAQLLTFPQPLSLHR